MANKPYFIEAKFFQWSTPIPIGISMHSPKFMLRDIECYLDLFTVGDIIILDIVSPKNSIEFDVESTVYILTKKGEIVERCSRGSLLSCEIWRSNVPVVEKYSHGSLLTFGIKFQFPSTDYPDTTNCLETLSEEFGKLLDDKTYSDAQVKCEDRIWHVHKNIISARSGNLVDTSEDDTKEGYSSVIHIEDLDKESTEIFLKFLYTGKLTSLTKEVAIQLYSATEKYKVSNLMTKCGEYLERSLNPENACEILIFANEHDNKDLKDRVINYIIQERITLNDAIWPDFCKKFPVLANEILNFICKFQCYKK